MMKQIQLAGSGGQGIITMAIILAEAAVSAGYRVAQTQSHGPEVRGRLSEAAVIIAKRPIYYPKVLKPDWVLAMTQGAADRYATGLEAETMIILDVSTVDRLPKTRGQIIEVAIGRMATEVLGNSLYGNVIALGFLSRQIGLVGYDYLQQAVLARVPERTREKNLQALAMGWEMEVLAEHSDVGERPL